MDRRRRVEIEPQASFDTSLLKEHIKGRLRQFVDTSIDARSVVSADDDVVSQKREIVERIRSSDSFRRWKTDVLRSEIEMITASAMSSRNLSRAVAEDQTAFYAIEDFGCDTTSWDSQNDDDEGEGDESQQQSNSGMSFALTGTMSATAFAFMGRNYLKHVVDILIAPVPTTDEDSTVVCDTIQALTQLPASDICESEHWADFKKALRQLLKSASDNQQRRLSDSVLGFLVKLFNASSHSVTVDAFGLLADHLKEDVFGSERIIYRVKDGRRLEFENGGGFVFQKLRVLDEMCSGFARVLARYSQQHLLDVAEKLLALLDSDLAEEENENVLVLTPFVAWSFLDPKVKWWRNWMHGRLGRMAILAALEKHWPTAEFLLKMALGSSQGDGTGSIERTVNILKAAVASRMVEGLLAYRESRLVLARHIPNFPEDQVNRLLKNSMEEGQRSKFAWKIIFMLAENPSGRSMFLEERRLRRIGMELLNKTRTYHTKIKLLNFISELPKSYDPSSDSVAIFHSPIEYRDGTATFCQLVMNAISDFIVAAYSRDPDVPLSLVYACFDTCAVLCRSQLGRKLVCGYEEFLLFAVRLVKEHSVEVSTLMPILASVSLEDPTSDFALKKFLGSHGISDARFDGRRGPILWYRPVEVTDLTVQTVANGLKDLEAMVIRATDPEATEWAVQPYFRNLFLILCHPEGGGLLLRNSIFMKTLMQPFCGDEFQETPYTEVLLDILEFALNRADFLVGIRENCDLIKEIARILTQQYSWEEETGEGTSQDDVPKFWVQNAFSTKLVDIYLRLGHLAGPNERLVMGSELTTLNELLSDSTKYFCSEPSRFLVRPVTTGAVSLREGLENEELIRVFIGFVEKKKRVQYSEMLMEAVKDFKADDLESDAVEGTSRVNIYEAVLQYGKNLGIIEYEGASAGFPSFIHKAQKLTRSSDTENEVDWFAAVIFLIFGGRSQNGIEFLHRFSQTESSALKCAWPRMSSELDFASVVVKEIASLMDLILENELPRVLAALTMHGITTSNLATFWLNQSFVNILDWPEICNYTALTILGGIRYQAFFCCCLCDQMCEEICDRAHGQKDDRDLHSFLIGPISFKLHKCIPFLSYLSDKYM